MKSIGKLNFTTEQDTKLTMSIKNKENFHKKFQMKTSGIFQITRGSILLSRALYVGDLIPLQIAEKYTQS